MAKNHGKSIKFVFTFYKKDKIWEKIKNCKGIYALYERKGELKWKNGQKSNFWTIQPIRQLREQ